MSSVIIRKLWPKEVQQYILRDIVTEGSKLDVAFPKTNYVGVLHSVTFIN